MEALVGYSLRLAPGIAAVALVLALLPRKLTELRLVVWILAFVLARDTMTPLKLWTLGGPGFMRLPDDVGLLAAMGASSLAIVALVQALEPSLRALVVWTKNGWPQGIAAGVLGMGVVVAPVLVVPRPAGIAPPAVPHSVLPVLLAFCLAGNLLEEVLFRGYLQGLLERHVTPVRAALLSGAFFAVFHASLATAVTDAGPIVLVFTLWEGTLCGFLRMRYGVLASTIAHGSAIFLIASGIA